MDHWSKWPYWVRWGVTTILFGIGMYVNFATQGASTLDDTIIFWASFPIVIGVLVLLYGNFGVDIFTDVQDLIPAQHIAILIIATVIYFFIGVCLGWLYGKIKTRRNSQAIN